MNRRTKIVRIIKRSCLTGRVVWIYYGKSHNAARKAYWKVCKNEVRRVRQWTARMAERKKVLMRMLGLGDSSSSSGIYDGMTTEQRAAAKEIVKIVKAQPPVDREFYDHIIAEAKHRNWLSERWKENRTKMIRYGKYK